MDSTNSGIDSQEDQELLNRLNRRPALKKRAESILSIAEDEAASELILRSATSPWRHADNVPPVREILTLKLVRQVLGAIRNDFHQARYQLKNLYESLGRLL